MLHTAAALFGDVGVCEVLLACGAYVDARDAKNRTPLHAAASRCYGGVCELLVVAGADGVTHPPGVARPLPIPKLSSLGTFSPRWLRSHLSRPARCEPPA